MSIDRNAARIRRDLPAAELAFDQALLASTRLFETLVTARLESNLPPATGQAALVRMAEIQKELVHAQSNLLRVHGEMLEVEKATFVEPEGCPPPSGAFKLKAVA